jgi:serine/threonine protein kinase
MSSAIITKASGLAEIDSQANLNELAKVYKRSGGDIVFFVGAGLSRNADLPDWAGLRLALQSRWQADLNLLAPCDKVTSAKHLLGVVNGVEDHWVAFKLLKDNMNKLSYEDTFRANLDAENRLPVPQVIESMIALNPKGIATLNADNMIERACLSVNGRLPPISTGKFLKSHIIRDPSTWVIKFHGDLSDSASWIFTSDELSALFENQTYNSIIKAIFATKTVVFVGVTANDVAVDSHLKAMQEAGISLDGHYWITTKLDITTANWASIREVRTIVYNHEEVGHSEALLHIFDRLRRWAEYYGTASPINPGKPSAEARLDQATLRALSPEETRLRLSSYATTILSGGAPNEEYAKFLKEYRHAVNHAYYFDEDEDNTVFGYKLIPPRIGGGAFGKVYVASADGEEEVAIKLIRPDVRDDPVMLNSFRQGIQSMRILTGAKVPGMVQLKEAYEIPPTIVMEYINGRNLQSAFCDKLVDPLVDGIPLMRKVFEIVRSAHDLPENVLHRDIRPSNVMVRDIDVIGFSVDNVVVLDFDLSWHRKGDDYLISENMATDLGYLVPEQLLNTPDSDRKSPAVDVYGMGMTLFFIFSGRNPQPNERRSVEWDGVIEKIRSSRQKCAWKSVMPRIARLINAATHPIQPQRVAINNFGDALSELEACVRFPDVQPEGFAYWVEELIARAFGPTDYEWSDERVGGLLRTIAGIEISVCGMEVLNKSVCVLNAARKDTGDYQYNNIKKYWKDKAAELAAVLRKGGWSLADADIKYAHGDMSITAAIQFSDMKAKLDAASGALSKFREKINF